MFVAKKVKEIISGGPTEIAIKAYLEDACHYTLGLKDEVRSVRIVLFTKPNMTTHTVY